MSDDHFITHLHISTNSDEESILRAQDFNFINVNLNSGNTGKRVLLWYKKGCGEKPITRIQFSFTDQFKPGLVSAGFEQISRDLNAGTGGDHIFLWYLCGDTDDDVPIVDLKVTVNVNQEPGLLKDGYERLGCDLNRHSGGDYVYLWVKRKEPTYIYAVTATAGFDRDKSLFEKGFTRVDENTNRGAGGDFVFLWYRRSKDRSKALSALEVSISFQEAFNLQQKDFKQVITDLNKGTGGSEIYIWTQDEGCHKIQAINLLINDKALLEYQKGGVQVIEKNLNEGTKGNTIYAAFYAA